MNVNVPDNLHTCCNATQLKGWGGGGHVNVPGNLHTCCNATQLKGWGGGAC